MTRLLSDDKTLIQWQDFYPMTRLLPDDKTFTRWQDFYPMTRLLSNDKTFTRWQDFHPMTIHSPHDNTFTRWQDFDPRTRTVKIAEIHNCHWTNWFFQKINYFWSKTYFFKKWSICYGTTAILLRISPRSFLAWFWSIFSQVGLRPPCGGYRPRTPNKSASGLRRAPATFRQVT